MTFTSLGSVVRTSKTGHSQKKNVYLTQLFGAGKSKINCVHWFSLSTFSAQLHPSTVDGSASRREHMRKGAVTWKLEAFTED